MNIFNIYVSHWIIVKDDRITKETLKPITKVNSKLDKELQDLEVESTKDGGDLNQ